MRLKIPFTMLFILFHLLHGQPLDPDRYYPSAVGDRWRWVHAPDSSVYDIEITRDSVAQNGNRFIFYNDSTSPRYMIDGLHQVWQIIQDTPVLWHKLAASPGDSFSVLMSGNSYTVNVDSQLLTIFGAGIPTKVFSWSYGKTYPNYAIQRLAYGIGFFSTNSTLYNLDDYVTGCVIDGKGFGTLTGITVNPHSAMPNYSLEEAYPNPFNSSTTIRYTLGTDTQARIDVFDLLGRRLQTLIDAPQHAGQHQVSFSGATLTTGIYLVRMQAGHFSAVRRILLLK